MQYRNKKQQRYTELPLNYLTNPSEDNEGKLNNFGEIEKDGVN